MTKVCSECNKEYDDSYKFCEICGTELSEKNNEENKETGFLTKVIEKGNELKEKHDDYYAEQRQKNAEKRRLKEEKKFAKKMENRTATEREYGFFYDDISEIYKEDAKKADKVYKAYITGGFSRLEKVNGRFLASQLIKLEVINQQNNRIIQQNNEVIEQNNEIIELLRQIAEK